MAAKRKTTRRDFLAGRSALQAISQLPPEDTQADLSPTAAAPGAGSSLNTDQTPIERGAQAYLIQVARNAMACEFQVLLNAGQHPGATEAALEALDLVETLEDQLTVFREDSELNRINQVAGGRPVPVESRLFQLLEQSVRLHEATAGAFDVTAGPLWRVWGFHRRAGRFPSQPEVDRALAKVGTQWLQLDAGAATVSFNRPGLELNLGGIGKGFALDRCRELLGQRGVEDFVIHGGHSSIIAEGSRLGADPEGGWTIAIRHPLRHEQQLLQIRLRNQALGTSGSGNQFFHFRGKRYAHVIDPRSGFPAEGLLSATVLASSAAEADALATAFFVMGADAALEYCAARPDLAAVLVCPSERTGEVTIRTQGLADADWQRLG